MVTQASYICFSFFNTLEILRDFIGFSIDFLEIAGLSHSKNRKKKVSSGTLATLPLPPSFQTFFATSTTLATIALKGRLMHQNNTIIFRK